MKVTRNNMVKFFTDEIANCQQQAEIHAHQMYLFEKSGDTDGFERARRAWEQYEAYWDAACSIYAHFRKAIYNMDEEDKTNAGCS